ncbi:MAG: hypothetical protein M3253_01635, partial [Chloroflexota bacterium]|nr:hypothetical protein [Chloroflexota bacterium]
MAWRRCGRRRAVIGRLAGIGAALALVALVAVVLFLRPPPANVPARQTVVTLPTHRDFNGGPAALLFGQLMQEGECFHVTSYWSAERHLVIWPSGT